jgi:hypothetical protein
MYINWEQGRKPYETPTYFHLNRGLYGGGRNLDQHAHLAIRIECNPIATIDG